MRLVKTFSKMSDSEKILKAIRDPEGNISWNGLHIIPLGRKRVRIIDGDYDLTPEIQTAFSDTRYKFNNNAMDDESVLNLDKFLKTLKYNHAQNYNSKRIKSVEKDLQ